MGITEFDETIRKTLKQINPYAQQGGYIHPSAELPRQSLFYFECINHHKLQAKAALADVVLFLNMGPLAFVQHAVTGM
jgi:hypothetical protein